MTCVHKTFDTSNETHQGLPDGSQGYLAACYRNIVDTKPSHFLSRIRNQIEIQIENRKKPNGPNRKLNRLKRKKIPHTLCHFGLLLGLIDVVQCLHKLRTLAFLQTQRCRGNSICQLLPYYRLSESALCKLCTSINQPYLIWAAVHCPHVPQPKDQGDWDPQSNKPRCRYWKE